jgi:hypothetical protein
MFKFGRKDHLDWLWRSAACAFLSALALRYFDRLESFYWAPGLAFSLLVVAARSRKPELLAAVTLAYTVGYACGDLLEPLGTWPDRLGVVAIGSALLAASLRWKGGFSTAQAREIFLLGSALGLPFWLILTNGPDGMPGLPRWTLGFAAWQMPVAWYFFSQRRRS